MWKIIINQKLKKLSTKLANKFIKENQIERFIKLNIKAVSEQEKMNKRKTEKIENYIKKYIKNNYNEFYCDMQKVYLYKYSDLNNEMYSKFK